MEEKKNVPGCFGSMVFDDQVMRARLSPEIYHSLKQTIRKGAMLDLSLANAVASAMCAWAVEKALPILPIPAADGHYR